jgi:hypothetical protein
VGPSTSRNKLATLTFSDFSLSDARLIRVEASRFKTPEEATTKGYTRAQMSSACPVPSADAPGKSVRLVLKMALDGYSGEQVEAAERYFSIESEIEYLFVSEQSGYIEDTHVRTLIHLFIAQAHPMQMEKMRRMAQEMGFNGVSPVLGFEGNESELLIEEALPQATKKAKRRKPS